MAIDISRVRGTRGGHQLHSLHYDETTATVRGSIRGEWGWRTQTWFGNGRLRTNMEHPEDLIESADDGADSAYSDDEIAVSVALEEFPVQGDLSNYATVAINTLVARGWRPPAETAPRSTLDQEESAYPFLPAEPAPASEETRKAVAAALYGCRPDQVNGMHCQIADKAIAAILKTHDIVPAKKCRRCGVRIEQPWNACDPCRAIEREDERHDEEFQ